MTGSLNAELAVDLLEGRIDLVPVLSRIAAAISGFDLRQIPPAEPGLLLSAIAIAKPDINTDAIQTAIAAQLEQADLGHTQQPGLDELFRMLETLVFMAEADHLQPHLTRLLTTEHLHPRWEQRAIDLLAEIALRHAETLDPDALIGVTVNLSVARLEMFLADVLEPAILARPASVTTGQIERLAATDEQQLAGRYLLYALAGHIDAPAAVGTLAQDYSKGLFPLHQVWRSRTAGRALKVVCVDNIAGEPGDKQPGIDILLQALLDDHSGTTVTIVTDQPTHWDHPQLTAISFDEPDSIRSAINSEPDVLVHLCEQTLRHRNHDPDLTGTIDNLVSNHPPPLYIQAGSDGDGLAVQSLQVGGTEWASAFALDWMRGRNLTDPVQRLLAELGLTFRIREHSPDPARKPVWLQLLQRAGSACFLPLLRSSLESEDVDIRHAATVALQAIRSDESTSLLGKLLDDPDHRVRGAAAGALLNRGIPDINPATLWSYRLIGSPHPNWQHLIHAGIAARPALLAALYGDSPAIRREAAIAIEAIGRQVFHDPYWMDRNHA